MSAEQAITLADHLATSTGEAYVVVHGDRGYKAIPVRAAADLDILEVVLP